MRRYSSLVFGVLVACGGGTKPAPTTLTNHATGNSTTPEAGARLAPSVFDKPAFSASAKELLALGAAAPNEDDHVAVVLYEEYAMRFDDNHRLYTSWRYVYVMKSADPDKLDSWGERNDSWRSSLDGQPTFKARVVASDGSVATMDASAVHYNDAPDGDVATREDSASYSATLPPLTLNAVVEEEVIYPPSAAPLPFATESRFFFAGSVPTLRSRVIVSAPAELHVAPVALNLPPAAALHDTKAGVETWTYEVGPMNPRVTEYDVAPDGGMSPTVGVGLAKSWNQVASEYGSYLDRRIKDDPVAYPPNIPKTATTQTVQALLAYVRATAPDAGLDYNQSPITPRGPGAVVKAQGQSTRLEGALLLVALMREAGMIANVSLLASGPGPDTALELPGIVNFDDAIACVHVDGKILWISTRSHAEPLGTLAPDQQNRRTLVLAATSQTLAKTPGTKATDNTIVETRSIALSDLGAGKLVMENSYNSGFFDSELRQFFDRAGPDEIRKWYEDYVKTVYIAKYTGVAASNTDDFSGPFQLTITGHEVGAAWTTRAQIDLDFPFSEVTDKAPEEMRDATWLDTPRARAFAWPTPYEHEVHWHYEVPDGFAPSADLPADEVRQLGTTTLTRKLAFNGNTLDVTLRFSSGKRVLTKAEFDTTQAALIKALTDKQLDIHVELDSKAWHLALDDKIPESIAAGKAIAAAHPKLAVDLDRYAYALNLAGLNLAARRLALQGTKVQPTDADAWLMYGWTLRGDELGRMNIGNFDPKGAVAAIRRGRKLDPTSAGAAMAEARVLELDPRGYRYEAGSDPKGALAAWTASHKLEPTEEAAIGLAVAQLRNGLFSAADTTLRGSIDAHGHSADVDSTLMAAIMLTRGAQGVRSEADTWDYDETQRTKLGDDTVSELKALRYYDEARTAGEALGAAQSTRIDRQPVPAVKSANPTDAALGALAWLAAGAEAKDPLVARIVDRDTADELEREQTSASIDEWLDAAGPTSTRDMALTFASPILTSGPAGLWRVELTIDEHRNLFYVRLVGGVTKVIGTAKTPESIGRAVMALATANESQAEALLDWMVADAPTDQLQAIWGQRAHDKATALAAGAVLAGKSGGAKGATVLAHCPTIQPLQTECYHALVTSSAKRNQWAAVLAATTTWLKTSSDDASSHLMKGTALAHLGKFDDAATELAAAGDASRNPYLAGALAELALARKDLPGAVTAVEPISHSQIAPSDMLLQAAVVNVYAGGDLTIAKAEATRAVGKDEAAATPEALSILAIVEAERGELALARTHILASMTHGHRSTPDTVDYYVFGRIAEQAGLPAEAAELYKRVKREPADEPLPTPYLLAQRRLAKLPK